MNKKKLRIKLEKQEKLLKIFFKSDEGKKILEKNMLKLRKDLKNKTGWFSKEEDEAWKFIQ